MNKYKNVLSPINIGPMKLKNRVSFSPVWPSFATSDGYVNLELMEWTRDIVKGGVACINIGCGCVNRFLPKEVSHLLRLGDEAVVNGLSQLSDLIHMYNCKFGLELFVINMSGESYETRDSHGNAVEVEIDPNTLTKEQIAEYIEDFANAAERAVRCGVDSLVIHGAHGQLPGCFLSKLINKRTDEYGVDSIENSSRFTVELLQAIRKRVGNKVAIEYRINANDMIPGSPNIDEVIDFVKCIESEINLLHVSRGMHAMQGLTPYILHPIYFEHGMNIEDATKIKAAISIPVTVVGSVTLEQAEEAIANGQIDMVSMARGLMADPELVNNAKHGRSEKTRPCIRCNCCIQKTHYHFAPLRCAVNPEMGMETLYMNIPAITEQKKIAVIGGGPAGMEAGCILAQKGHSVVLYEKSDKLGGVLNMATCPEFKKDLKDYMNWSIDRTINQKGLEIKLNTCVDSDIIKSEEYDAVFVAIGSEAIIPESIATSNKVVWVGDVETNKCTTGQNVIVVGAGLTGCETALSEARKGKTVTLVDMIQVDQFANGGAKFNQTAIVELLKKANVKMIGNAKLKTVDDKGAHFVDESGKDIVIECDNVVLSLGVRPNVDIVNSFADCAVDVIFIGDCVAKQGTLYNAVHTAHELASTL